MELKEFVVSNESRGPILPLLAYKRRVSELTDKMNQRAGSRIPLIIYLCLQKIDKDEEVERNGI